MAKKKKMMMRRRSANVGSMIAITLVVAAILIVVLIKNNELETKKAALNSREQYLLSQIEIQNERSEEIEEYRKYTQTKKYVEDLAKSRLGLVYKDEIIFETE